MTTVRRRVLRPEREPAVDLRQAARLERLRQKLDRERAALDRWMAKLKRSFHAVKRGQRRIARIERQLKKEAGYRFVLPAMQQQREEGGTLQEMANWLNEQGHETTRHKAFDAVQVHRLLAKAT